MWNHKFHISLHKDPSPPPHQFVSQVNSTHAFKQHLPNIHFSIISHLCVGLPSILLLSDFRTKSLRVSYPKMRAAYSAHLVFLDLDIVTIFSEQ